MSFDLRMPNITGVSEREQLVQIRSYLYQLIPQLQWALSNLESTSSSASNLANSAITTARQAINGNSASKPDKSAEATFNDIKSLIIKSADIVEAYYEEINSRLEGVYVAESDFGTFAEKTSMDIEATSTYVEQKFNDVQVIISGEIDGLNATIDTKIDGVNGRIDDVGADVEGALKDIEGLKTSVLETNAHITSGILYYDDKGFPVYGVEIGQQNKVNGEDVYKKYARFTADRLSFYDQNDTEVAYISDQKLYISNVEVTSSFKIGGYRDTVIEDGGVVTKWVGGNG